MNYVLITGCNGFIGSYLTKLLLSKGFNVLGLSTGKKPEITSENFKYERINLTDCLSVEKIFYENKISDVIHLAGIAHLKGRKKIGWNEFYRVNTLASKTLFDCAAIHKARIFYASTVDVYGNKNTAIISEEHKPNPESNYGRSKYLAELILKDKAAQNSVDYAIGRFAPVYSSEFMRDVYKRIYLKYPSLAFVAGKGYNYHFVSVYNVIDFIINWLETNNNIYGTYNVCDSELINTNKFLAFEKEIGNAHNIISLPSFMFTLGNFLLNFLPKVFKLEKFNKIRTNINKLINPDKYSTKKMETVFIPRWNLENTVYRKLE